MNLTHIDHRTDRSRLLAPDNQQQPLGLISVHPLSFWSWGLWWSIAPESSGCGRAILYPVSSLQLVPSVVTLPSPQASHPGVGHTYLLQRFGDHVVEWCSFESVLSHASSQGMGIPCSYGTTLLALPMGPSPTLPAGIEWKVDHILEILWSCSLNNWMKLDDM